MISKEEIERNKEVINKQLSNHYKEWYKKRSQDHIFDDDLKKVTCSKCKEKFPKIDMKTKTYGQQERKVFYYCFKCYESIDSYKNGTRYV